MGRTLLKLPLLALIAFSGSVLAIDADKKEIVIGTTVGDFADMVTESVKPYLEQLGYQVKRLFLWLWDLDVLHQL